MPFTVHRDAGPVAGRDQQHRTRDNPGAARTFELAKVDPCVLLTRAQRAQLGVAQPVTPRGDTGNDPTRKLMSTTGASYGVFRELTATANDTVGVAGGKVSSTVTIDGFDVPLISVPKQGCSAFVNTGDSEYLPLQANGTGVAPDDELCRLVQPATPLVLANLTALPP